ncbi:MAG: copper resistance system multicopper oxidase [Methylicorpusculum sp.]|jgi:CopA family copper-resistance protein|uniref:copper resistance system multicopper oxidase n=1 Tax=Methylicorpusculum TaxID=2713642 RepID=UPI00135CB8D7|nr:MULTISPECIES: copper resistance system multicopper oxidase [Methylicorpusculum]MCD2452094.1 copper resistance system multicopper oxidase [Methylicorpusculum oleiharenae]MDP2203450.1 copper resistance system multicopper oxidase [Methylicorpusculum sp.]
MKPNSKPSLLLPNPSRRRFIEGLAAGGMLLGLSPWIKTAQAKETTQPVEILTGTEFNLTIAETSVNFTGAPRVATTVNGSIPAPTLRWREGDTVTLRVTNRLAEETSIHWHGMLPPYQMDGVPGISFKGIAPGETFTYRFKVQQSGTYWYHSHSGMQEQTGLYGAIIVDPASADPIRADLDYVVQLSDWTDEDPMRVFDKLKNQSDYYNFNQPTAGDFFRDAAGEDVVSAIQKRHMWNMMRMNYTDLSDISAYTYTYLMNGTTPAGNWTGLFSPGEKVRLRFINSGSMTFFDMRIPGLKMTVVQADAQNVEPVTVDEFRIGPAETYDVIVTPEEGAYTLFAQSMDRTGYARGTLAMRAGMTAAVPSLDKPEPLTMADMMGNMGNMGNGEMQGMNHGGMAMDHSAHAMGGQVRVRHARTEYGPSVDMRVDTPRTNLDDPGIGLRNNGRRVLTYADLHTIGGPLDTREPVREIELHLTGNMERYSWSLDGLEFGKSTPIHFRYGERLRVIFVNDTMMTHPMHLHGMWQELESPDGRFQVRKHTIIVQPAQRVTFLATPDGLGRWAWHCHLFLHMHAGMMREVVVA